MPLFIRASTPDEQIGRVKETTAADGSILRVALLTEERDENRHVQTALLHYEKHSVDHSVVVHRP